MSQLRWARWSAGFALSGLCFFGLYALRQPDIPHATLDRRYARPHSAVFDGPDGVGVHYLDEGPRDGFPLVLVHGYSASHHTWRAWAETLSARYRVISIDLPGHGLSRTPRGYRVTRRSFSTVIEALAQHLRLSRFALAGNSMGGAAAWDYAARRPNQVAALILVAAAGWTPQREQSFLDPAVEDLLSSPAGPLLRDLDNTDFIRRGLRASFADSRRIDENMVQRYVDLSRAPMHRDVQMQIALNHDARLYACPISLGLIRAPTLILHGERDRVVPVGDAAKFADHIADARLITYAGAGHILQEERAAESARDVGVFLDVALGGRARAAARRPAAAALAA